MSTNDLAKQLEQAAVEAFKKQINDTIGRMRCRIHGKAAKIRFGSGNTEVKFEDLCCDAFKAEIERAIKK